MEKATVAGGCFWCIEADYEKLDGVLSAVSGYAGGTEKDPEYEDVAYGRTGHAEAVMVEFDPSIISYEKLVDYFFKHHDPTDGGGQFADRGPQYRPAVFYHSQEQKKTAEKVKKEIQKLFEEPLVTETIPFTTFFPAEKSQQKFAKKHAMYYTAYRHGSGRAGFLERWKHE